MVTLYVVCGLLGVAAASWLLSVLLAVRAARLRLPWSKRIGGPVWVPQREEMAAGAAVWARAMRWLGTFAGVAVLVIDVVAKGQL